jgi:hypothetical protein
MLEVKPITKRDTFVQPVQTVSAVAKEAHHQVAPATMVTISAAATALSGGNRTNAKEPKQESDRSRGLKRKLDEIFQRLSRKEGEKDVF